MTARKPKAFEAPEPALVCSQNKLSSPTAEHVFSQYPGIEAASAGTNNDAVTSLDGELVEWADVIFVMEKAHLNKLRGKFKKHLNGKRVICLDIPDECDFMEPAPVRLLQAKVGRHLWRMPNLPGSHNGRIGRAIQAGLQGWRYWGSSPAISRSPARRFQHDTSG